MNDNLNLSTVVDNISIGFIKQFENISPDNIFSLSHLLQFENGYASLILNWKSDTESVDDTDLYNESLLLKLYEPLPDEFDVGELVWISKLHSPPIIDTIVISDTVVRKSIPLKGPNFDAELVDFGGYRMFDDLIARGTPTSAELIQRYVSKNIIDTNELNIRYADDNRIEYESFVFFGSAGERIKNFWYKLRLLESYNVRLNKLNEIQLKSTLTNTDFKNLTDKINILIASFDGFEEFLYRSNSTYAYPKDSGVLLPTSHTDSIAWYNSTVSTASDYDINNVNYLVNNIPNYIPTDSANSDYVLFLDMIGQYFDVIWAYINGIRNLKLVGVQSRDNIPNQLISTMIKSMGWDIPKSFDTSLLWEYIYGKDISGSKRFSFDLKSSKLEIWHRLASNIPYILKHKGTSRSLKAVMACYGVPQSLLTILEYGGSELAITDNVEFTFVDNTASLRLEGSQYIQVPWKSISGEYSDAIEIIFRPSEYEFELFRFQNNLVKFDVVSDGDSYKPRLTIGASVALGDSFTPSLDNFSIVVVNRKKGTPNSEYEVIFKTSDGERIVYTSTFSLTTENTAWETVTNVRLGVNFIGVIDEFRIWKFPLNEPAIDSHALYPNAIGGNTYSSSFDDLYFRLDFEYPKDRGVDTQIKNVAIATNYTEPFATAVGFVSIPNYPYQYVTYDRTVTLKMPSTGIGYSNKFRTEFNVTDNELSYLSRASKPAYERGVIDSPKLGLHLSPSNVVNLDIAKTFGRFSIDDFIGSPSDDYSNTYKSLETARRIYFKHVRLNIYEYIRMVKTIDRSLFDVLKTLVPARAKVSTGILIEPHILNRNKIKRYKPISNFDYLQSNPIEVEVNPTAEYNTLLSELDFVKSIKLSSEIPVFDATIDTEDIIVRTISKRAVFQQFGGLPHGIDTVGFSQASFEDDGSMIFKKLNVDGTVTSQRGKLYVITEGYIEWEWTQTEGWPTDTQPILPKYEWVPVVKQRKYVTFKPLGENVIDSVDSAP